MKFLPAAGILALVGIAAAAASPRAAQRTVLGELLDKAGGYVVRYEHECSAVVAEERYLQELVAPPGRPTPSRTQSGPLRRELVSDVLMVQLPDETYFGFRDVAIVDGQPVRDRGMRLENLFLKSRASLRQVQEESARYNIGRIQRTMNVPTYALAILHPALRDRFAFGESSDEVIDDRPAAVISFDERARPTIVTDPRGTAIPSSGRFWIDKTTGAVLRTRLVTGTVANDVRAESTVTYRAHQEWPLLLPVEMRESYDEPQSPGALRVVCLATYSNFRRFNVTVDESVKVPK